jgi:hypothetical protein
MTSRLRVGAFVAALALVGACSSGGKDDKVTAAASDTATTTTDLAGEFGLTTTTGVPGASGATVKGATATTAKGATPVTTAKPAGGTTATTAAPVAADPNAVPGPAKNGTYHYSQSGTMPDGSQAPPSGTLLVNGGSTQTFNRSYSSKQSVTLTYQFRGDGPYITGATVRASGITISCSFGGVPVPPWPPTPGRSFSGSATCTNGLTATFSGSIGSRAKSGAHDIIPINGNLHISGNGVDVNVAEFQNWAYDLRVPTYEKQTFSGTTPFGPINGSITSSLTGTP